MLAEQRDRGLVRRLGLVCITEAGHAEELSSNVVRVCLEPTVRVLELLVVRCAWKRFLHVPVWVTPLLIAALSVLSLFFIWRARKSTYKALPPPSTEMTGAAGFAAPTRTLVRPRKK